MDYYYCLTLVFGLLHLGQVALSAPGDFCLPQTCVEYDELGCFCSTAPFFDPSTRPVPHLPWSPVEIGTRFLLYTRYNQFTEQFLSYDDPTSITSSNFMPYRKTKIIVHGFNSDSESTWIPKMKNAILNAEHVNVIVVDWRQGADPIIYGQAATNTRVVGAQIGYLIKVMMDLTGCLARDFHITGHSLGAHTAGYAGEWLRENVKATLGRITGMDAAGPYFAGTPAEVRLDPTDASFVDAIHTDADPFLNLGWGIAETVGHADFYPNGGVDQPGCPGNEVDDGAWWKISCSHSRAHELFTDSIVNWGKPMYGYTCQDYQTFLSGACLDCPVSGCPAMGYYSEHLGNPSVETTYFLTTRSEEPFAAT